MSKADTQTKEELEKIEQESVGQKLPEQGQVFSISKKYSKLNNLPDPTNPPIGYEPNKGYDNVFPFVKLPFLHPADEEDNVSFGFGDAGYLDEKNKKHPLNAVYFGDNLQILRSLPSNSIDLIYIDPPFFSGRVYNQVWGDNNEVRTFNDIWDGGMPTYLIWLNARLWEMKRVLRNTGSIYVHLDWHASHYVKTEMDKIFGYENFINEIIWCYTEREVSKNSFNKKHDAILLYAKNKKKKIFNYKNITLAYSEGTYKKFNLTDKDGGKFQVRGGGGHLTGKQGLTLEDEKKYPDWTYRDYLDKKEGVLIRDWIDYIPFLNRAAKERLGYPTQKPEKLIELFLKASSNKGDVVADFFMGGGGTLAVAQKLGRRFVGSDISRVATSVTLDRLVRDGEDMTGQKASTNKSKEGRQGMLIEKVKVPDIKVYYHGVYPVEKFEKLPQEDFENFILTSFGASKNTVDDSVTGFKNQFNPILVGPVSKKDELSIKQVKNFVQSVIRNHIQQNQRYVLTILAWRFQPEVKKYTKQLQKSFFKKLKDKSVVLEIELVPIRNHKFRERITSTTLTEDDKEKLLQFVESPIITDIICKKKKGLTYKFEAIAKSINVDGYLINCQWDFNFADNNFSEPGYSLNREKRKGGGFEAILTVEKTFEKKGTYKIACKVQDSFGGEITKVIEVKIK